jgi:hypothetical protein
VKPDYDGLSNEMKAAKGEGNKELKSEKSDEKVSIFQLSGNFFLDLLAVAIMVAIVIYIL